MGCDIGPNQYRIAFREKTIIQRMYSKYIGRKGNIEKERNKEKHEKKMGLKTQRYAS